MRLRTFVVLAVIIGINTPLCTGGVFALAGALAQVSDISETLLMTRAPAAYLACSTEDTEPTQDVQSSRSGSCSGSKACLAKMTATAKEILSFLSPLADSVLSVVIGPTPVRNIAEPDSQYAGAGPPFSSVLLSAHILIQRE